MDEIIIYNKDCSYFLYVFSLISCYGVVIFSNEKKKQQKIKNNFELNYFSLENKKFK